jgi:hypothetical protein
MELNWTVLSATGIVVLGLVICWGAYIDFRKKLLAHEERRLLIERGLTPPPVYSAGWPGVKQQEQQLKHEERRLRIEKGLPIDDPVPFPGLRRGPLTPTGYLQRGTTMLCVAIGMGLSALVISRGGFRMDGEADTWIAGLSVLACVIGLFGLANLINARVARKEPAGPDATSA